MFDCQGFRTKFSGTFGRPSNAGRHDAAGSAGGSAGGSAASARGQGRRSRRWYASAAMEARDLRDLVHFDPDGPATHELFETEHLWSQLICLERTQRVGPIGDATSDALFVVIAGEVVIQVDKGRTRVKQWSAVL